MPASPSRRHDHRKATDRHASAALHALVDISTVREVSGAAGEEGTGAGGVGGRVGEGAAEGGGGDGDGVEEVVAGGAVAGGGPADQVVPAGAGLGRGELAVAAA